MRVAIRKELAMHNKHLAAAAKQAGVKTSLGYAIFQDHSYKGLYGGMGNKGLKKSQKTLNHSRLGTRMFEAIRSAGVAKSTTTSRLPSLAPFTPPAPRP